MRRALLLVAIATSITLLSCGGEATTPPPADQTAQATAPDKATPSGSSKPAPKPAAPHPAAPPKPIMVRLATGTVLEIELQDQLSTNGNKAGDAFSAKVTDPVSIGGQEVIPAGSIVEGSVTQASSAKKMSGQAVLVLQFTRLTLPDGHSAEINADLTEKGKKLGGRTGGIIGGSAAGGALLGRIIGKDTKGTVIGGLVGAGVGTGIAAAQKGQDLKIPAGTALSIELDSDAEIPVPPHRG